MKADISSREFRDQIVGKRISGVIARPGRAGQPPVILMMTFDDGSVAEFVSPRSDQVLRRSFGKFFRSSQPELTQLPLMGLVANVQGG